MTQAREVLEILLAGRSATFKAKVLAVLDRHQLEPNDPNLEILIATGQLEVLLEEIPDRLQAIIDQGPRGISLRIDGAWQTAAFGLALGIAFGCLGGLVGWWGKSAQVYQHYSPEQLVYLDRLWELNADRLLQCQAKGAFNCEIRLGPKSAVTE